MPKIQNTPGVFSYIDYRLYLEDYYKARKSIDAKFSQRFIAAQVRASSAGWFADILKRRTNLSGTHRVRMADLLKLGEAEAAYFEVLVLYDHAGSMEEKNLQYKKLLALKGVKAEIVGKDRFEFYSAWHHSVVRELLFFWPFKGDYAALAKKLQPPIGAAQARKSIQVLERLGFIKKNSQGIYQPADESLKKDSAFKALHHANLMKSTISLGMESLDRFPKEERDISAVTIALSAEGFAKVKQEIRALREKLVALTETDAEPDKVFHCNFHIFPVTE